jgi:NAD(P)H-hydrate epimerase
MLDTTAAAVERDRLGAARALAARTGAVVVLKGARTLICAGDYVAINPTGGPALATAGSGDVLAGVIAALLAQEVPAVAAARLAVWIHGRAGDALGARWGERGAIASDLPDAIALALRDLAAGA